MILYRSYQCKLYQSTDIYTFVAHIILYTFMVMNTNIHYRDSISPQSASYSTEELTDEDFNYSSILLLFIIPLAELRSCR